MSISTGIKLTSSVVFKIFAQFGMSFPTFTDVAMITYTDFVNMVSSTPFTKFTVTKFIKQAEGWSSHFSKIIF